MQGATLTGAELQGATLDEAKLQGASLNRAKLQGATLTGAKLQGATLIVAFLESATLTGAELQGATLDDAQLQGATLVDAKLQGASLTGAELQGARLTLAKLQGATLTGAELQGATLDGAQLQGATLDDAKLQGASLTGAELQGADLSYALVWRADFSHATLTDMRAEELVWKPVSETETFVLESWTQARYEALRDTLTKAIPEGERRTEALKRIERLICTDTNGKSDCVEDAAHPQIKNLPDEAYAARLTETLKGLVCNGNDNAIYVLRGVLNNRLSATRQNAPKLIDDILNLNSCPVSADLTAEDKTQLLALKKDAEERFPPKLPPAKPAKAK